jgi:hypothetical protein
MVEMPRNANVVPAKKSHLSARKMPNIKNANEQKNIGTTHKRLNVNGNKIIMEIIKIIMEIIKIIKM